ncbi:22574_t:CDS:1, partial [Gigaspora rosea]
TFFEIETDNQGQPLLTSKRINRQLFAGLKISTNKYAIAQQ